MTRNCLIALLCACGGAHVPAPVPMGPGPEVTASLRLLEAESGDDDIPRSDAWIALIEQNGRREMQPLGTLEGVCHHESPDERDVLRVRCWWAGEGLVLRVSREGDRLIVRQVDIDEMTGPGTATEIATIDLPRGAQLSAVTP